MKHQAILVPVPADTVEKIVLNRQHAPVVAVSTEPVLGMKTNKKPVVFVNSDM